MPHLLPSTTSIRSIILVFRFVHGFLLSTDEVAAFSDVIHEDVQGGSLLDGGHVRGSGPDMQCHRSGDEAVVLSSRGLVPLH